MNSVGHCPVSDHECVVGEIPPCLSHTVHKVFGVTVGNVEADVADFRDCLGD